MDKVSSAANKAEPWLVVLTPEETKQLAGGLNPQPYPLERTSLQPNRSDPEGDHRPPAGGQRMTRQV